MTKKQEGATVREFPLITDDRVVEIDVSDEACSKFGLSPGERATDAYGRSCTVIGAAPVPHVSGQNDPPCIAPGSVMLWVSWDQDGGRVCFVPNPLAVLKTLKVH